MIFISEAQSAAALTRRLALDAVRGALVTTIAPDATSFPMVARPCQQPTEPLHDQVCCGGDARRTQEWLLPPFPRFAPIEQRQS